MTREEAGRKGGEKVAKEKGPEFYSEIGRKGGEKLARERGSEFYSEIGRKGGEKVAEEKGPKFYSEIGRKGGESRAARTEGASMSRKISAGAQRSKVKASKRKKE
jgi:general stress protein YciG